MIVDRSETSVILGVLKQGGVIAYPTDTVFGLMALCSRAESMDKIFRLKGRAAEKRLQLLVADLDMAEKLIAGGSAEISKRVSLFPVGTVSLVVNADRDWGVNPGGGTVAFRIPGDAWLAGLIKLAGVPLAATSANISGMAELQSAEEIQKVFGTGVDLIVSGSPGHHLPSTVVSLAGEVPELLRPGALKKDAIRSFTELKTNVLVVCTGNTCRSPMGEKYIDFISPEWVSVRSAGTDTANGFPVSEHSLSIMSEFGGRAYGVSRALDAGLYDWADIILTMEAYHRDLIWNRYGREKAFLLSAFALSGGSIGRNGKFTLKHSLPGPDIMDPVGGDEDLYRSVFSEISGYADGIEWPDAT